MSDTVSHIGEFGLIRRIRDLLDKEGVHARDVCVGMGDDTASFYPPQGYELLVTCDSMVEGRHYLPDRISFTDLGRRAMVSNISDIGAMGGTALYAVVSLGLRSRTLVRDVEAMYRGFLLELNPLGAAVIGGNLTKCETHPFIDITLIGKIEKGKGVRRSTARPGDMILVTGYPGQAAAGLQILLQSTSASAGGLQEHPLVRSYLTPVHRAREGKAIAETGLATAMIDISDGFLADLGHICEESGVGAWVVEKELPVSDSLRERAFREERPAYELVFAESDDYELIVTCAPEHADRVRAAVAAVSDVAVTQIGRLTTEVSGVQLQRADGTLREMTVAGWDHFSNRKA